MLQLEKREQESLEKAKQYAAQKRELEKRRKVKYESTGSARLAVRWNPCLDMRLRKRILLKFNLDYSRQCRESGRKPHSYSILTEYCFSPIK